MTLDGFIGVRVERASVVAFIDVLGFKDVMLSDAEALRGSAIELLKRVASYGATHGVEQEAMGPAVQLYFNPEITTFSDNIVLSAPANSVRSRVLGRDTEESASQFVTSLITTLVSIYWQGLHMGLLFRGAVTVGRLYHDGNVVAGEGLVRAVELEKSTRWPRVEVDSALLDAVDERGNPLVAQDVRDACIVNSDGKYFLRILGFHVGVWWDYAHFRGGEDATRKDVQSALENIRRNTRERLAILERQLKGTTDPKLLQRIDEVILKWRWFHNEFESSQQKSDWQYFFNYRQPHKISATTQRFTEIQ